MSCEFEGVKWSLLGFLAAPGLPSAAQVPREEQWERVDLEGDKCKAVPEESVRQVLKVENCTNLSSWTRPEELSRAHLPYQNVLRVFQICVVVQVQVINDVVHVVNNAINYREHPEDDHADHVFLHVEDFVGARGRQADERQHHRHAPNIFPPTTNVSHHLLSIRRVKLTIRALELVTPQSPGWKCPICLKCQPTACRASRRTASNERICRILGAICWEHCRRWKRRNNWDSKRYKLGKVKEKTSLRGDVLKIIHVGNCGGIWAVGLIVMQYRLNQHESPSPPINLLSRKLLSITLITFALSAPINKWEKIRNPAWLKIATKIFTFFDNVLQRAGDGGNLCHQSQRVSRHLWMPFYSLIPATKLT